MQLFDIYRDRRAFALPVVLIAIIVFAIIGVSAMGLFLNRGERLKTAYAQKQAQLAAEGAFNLAVGKLLNAQLSKRWFAQDTSAHVAKEISGSLLDVFLSDVFNKSGQLTHIHVVARCQQALGSGFKATCALVFGTVQISGEDKLTATVLSRQTLEPIAVEAFIKANEGLFAADNNPFAQNRRVSLSSTAYGGKLSTLQGLLAQNELAEIDFSDNVTMRSFVALLERLLELKRELLLARAANEMLRDSSIADVLRLAAETDVPLKDLLATLRAIQAQGAALTRERAGEISGQLSRSQRELLIIYLLLKRLAALPTDSMIELGGEKRTPKETARLLAKRLFKEVMGAETTESTLAKIFDKMLANGEKLDELNIFRTFFKIVNKASYHNSLATQMGTSAQGTQVKLPLRDQCIELVRIFEPESTRVAFNSIGFDVWQLGSQNTSSSNTTPLSDDDDDDDDDDDNGQASSAANVTNTSGQNSSGGATSKPGFERSVSALGLYEENSSTYATIRSNIEAYIQGLVDANGVAGYQEAALHAGLLGMNEEQAEAFGEILQDMVTDDGIRWLTLNIPSPLTETNPAPVAVEVPVQEIETISSLPTIAEETLGPSGGSEPSSVPPPTNSGTTAGTGTMENNYNTGGGGGEDLWVTVGTLVDEPIVGPNPPPPPPPPAPPPSSGGGGNQPSGGGGNQPGGGGNQPGNPGTTPPPPATTPSGPTYPYYGSGGDDDDDSSGGGSSGGDSGGDSGGFGCFVGETLVWTPQGYRQISELKIGDYVFSYDLLQERVVLGRICWCRSIVRGDIVQVKVADETLTCSDNHRFLTDEREWKAIGSVPGGLMSHTGKRVARIEPLVGTRRVYNFTTIPSHNYFVGQNRLIVHNIK